MRGIDCLEIARVAKRAGASANAATGVRRLRSVGDGVSRGEPLFEIHAQSAAQLEFARAHEHERAELVCSGFQFRVPGGPSWLPHPRPRVVG